MAYAGSTTLTMNTLLHRAHRASLSWRSFFRVDERLADEVAGGGGWKRTHKDDKNSKNEDGKDDDERDTLLGTCKRLRFRTRPLAKEAAAATAARPARRPTSHYGAATGGANHRGA